MSFVLDALKLAVEQELQISERLRDRARQVFVLAIAFFTIVQTVAFSAFAQAQITGAHHRAHLIVILAFGIAAIVFLAFTAISVSHADAPGKASDLPIPDPDAVAPTNAAEPPGPNLGDLLNDAYDDDPDVAGNLGAIYLGIITNRRNANDQRVRAVHGAQVYGLLSIAVTTAELIVALVFRIPGT